MKSEVIADPSPIFENEFMSANFSPRRNSFWEVKGDILGEVRELNFNAGLRRG